MRRRNIAAIGVAAAVFSGFVQLAIAGDVSQTDATKLKAYVQSNGLACLGCHGIDHKLIGPAWLDVAKKYHGDPKALADVSQRIANGGSGLWGQVPMPPNQATAAQAKTLAQMILALDPNATPSGSNK